MKKRTGSECSELSGASSVYLRLMVLKCSPHSLPCYHAHLLARRALLSLEWPPPEPVPGSLCPLPSAWKLCASCLWGSPGKFNPEFLAWEGPAQKPELAAYLELQSPTPPNP